MALADWDVTKNPAGIDVSILNQRLMIDNLATRSTNSSNFAHLRPNSSFPRGHLIGKIRTKMEITDHLLAGNRDGFYGVLCMMSQSDLTAGAGSCYCFGLRLVEPTTFEVDWALIKFTAGFNSISIHSSTANTILLGRDDQTLDPQIDVNYTLELQWCYHELIQGVNLIARVGLAENNFDDLQTVYDVTDTSTPLTTSVGEGLFYDDADGQDSNDLKRVHFDDTTIIPLTGIVLS